MMDRVVPSDALAPASDLVGEMSLPDPVVRAADGVRRVGAGLLRVRRDCSGLADVAERIHSLADSLEGRAESAEERMWRTDTIGRIARFSPVVGPANAIAPPLHLRRGRTGPDGRTVLEGTVRFTVTHQRCPGVAHDGIAAMVLDVALADANVHAGSPGMTVLLEIRFHRPIPIGVDLRVTAQHDSVDGRKARSSGRIWSGSELYASAEGLFVVSRREMTRGIDSSGS